jgi:hypothetical protein
MECLDGLRKNEFEKCESKLLFFRNNWEKPRRAAVKPARIQSWYLQNKSYKLYYLIQLHFQLDGEE